MGRGIETFEQYQARAITFANPDVDLKVMAALGIGGESGEILELVKKEQFHGIKIVRTELVSELGDMLWYLSALASGHKISLGLVAAYNIEKLSQRYPDGFVDGGGKR